MIWLIGGTSDSRTIAQFFSSPLCDPPIQWAATVVTPEAVRLYQGLPGPVHVGPLTPATIPQFLQTYGIRAIVDASHPFAVQISQLAIATGLPYLRFERPDLPLVPSPLLQSVATVQAAAQLLDDPQRRVLLTVGVNSLIYFQPWLPRPHLWARILPTPDSFKKAIALGFLTHQLILSRPPVPAQEERTLWQQLAVNTVITKASGSAGGMATKQAIALELGIQLIIIARPFVPYPRQTDALETLEEFCRNIG